MPSILNRPLSLGLGLAALATLSLAPAALRAADDGGHTEQPTLSDATGDGLTKVDTEVKAKDWDGALRTIDDLIKGATADSYDQAILERTIAQVETQKGDYPAATEPLEKSLEIADRHHYFQPKETLDALYFLSQLYYQKADSAKGDKDAQIAAYDKSIGYIKRWFSLSDRPTEDISMYYAQLLYGAAVAKNPKVPDPELIQAARLQVEKTLKMTVHPKDSLYQFLLATLQQQADYPAAANVLELLLAHNPNNKAYWQDLDMFYMAMAQDPKDKDAGKTRRFDIRAINTIERAQGLGYLNTPRDNYTLFTLYYNIGQYGLAADILHKGLASGGIESDLNNWLLLSACYQQINEDFKSIDALKEATSHFPTNGELEFKVAQAYLQIDNNDEAFKHAETALEKGHLVKPEQTYVFVAYMAYELQKYDEAKEAIDKAIALMKKPDHQATGLKNAIEEAIKEREAKKVAAQPDKA